MSLFNQTRDLFFKKEVHPANAIFIMLKHILSILIAVLFTLLLSLAVVAVAFPYEAKDYVTYFGTTDKEITVAWDAQEAATHYEVMLLNVERKIEVPAGSGSTETNSLTFKVPRSGHYIAIIRACNLEECSEWSESINPEVASVDGKPRAWWIYGHIAPAGTPTINKEP